MFLHIYTPQDKHGIWEYTPEENQFPHHHFQVLHPGKLTCPLKRDYFNRKYIFQPLIFRGHVSFRGCKSFFQSPLAEKLIHLAPSFAGGTVGSRGWTDPTTSKDQTRRSVKIGTIKGDKDSYGSILLMVEKSGVHQLSLVVYPIIYRVLYISGGAGFQPSTEPRLSVWVCLPTWMGSWGSFHVGKYSPYIECLV